MSKRFRPKIMKRIPTRYQKVAIAKSTKAYASVSAIVKIAKYPSNASAPIHYLSDSIQEPGTHVYFMLTLRSCSSDFGYEIYITRNGKDYWHIMKAIDYRSMGSIRPEPPTVNNQSYMLSGTPDRDITTRGIKEMQRAISEYTNKVAHD